MSADYDVVGAVGVLTVATRGADGPGEVHLPVRGGSESFLAWSERPLARGTSVLVVGSRGARTVDVMAMTGTDPAL